MLLVPTRYHFDKICKSTAHFIKELFLLPSPTEYSRDEFALSASSLLLEPSSTTYNTQSYSINVSRVKDLMNWSSDFSFPSLPWASLWSEWWRSRILWDSALSKSVAPSTNLTFYNNCWISVRFPPTSLEISRYGSTSPCTFKQSRLAERASKFKHAIQELKQASEPDCSNLLLSCHNLCDKHCCIGKPPKKSSSNSILEVAQRLDTKKYNSL